MATAHPPPGRPRHARPRSLRNPSKPSQVQVRRERRVIDLASHAYPAGAQQHYGRGGSPPSPQDSPSMASSASDEASLAAPGRGEEEDEWAALNARAIVRSAYRNVPGQLRHGRSGAIMPPAAVGASPVPSRPQSQALSRSSPRTAIHRVLLTASPSRPSTAAGSLGGSRAPDASMDMTTRVLASARNYSVFTSPTPRFKTMPGHQVNPSPDVASVDTGAKMSISTRVKSSGSACWPLRSQVPRFNSRRVSAFPGQSAKDHNLQESLASLPFYSDTDFGRPYATIATQVNTTSQRYSSAFNNLPRFQSPKGGDTRNSYKRPACVSQARFRTSKTRWGGTLTGSKKKKDQGREQAKRPNAQMYMLSSTKRFTATRPSTGPSIGPGTYQPKDFPSQASGFSKSARFLTPRSAAMPSCPYSPGIGAAAFERASQEWLESGWSMTRVPRVTIDVKRVLDQVYMTDSLHKTSLAKAVARSPIKYDRALECSWKRAAQCVRELTHSVHTVDALLSPSLHHGCAAAFLVGAAERETLGPGTYNPTTTNDGHRNRVHIHDASKLSVEFNSSVARFPDKPSSMQQSFLLRNDPSLLDTLANADYDVYNHNTMAGDIQKRERARQRSRTHGQQRKAAFTQNLGLRPKNARIVSPTRNQTQHQKSRATLRQPSTVTVGYHR